MSALGDPHLQIWLVGLLLVLMIAFVLGWARLRGELEATWLGIRADLYRACAWVLDTVVIRTIRGKRDAEIGLLQARLEVAWKRMSMETRLHERRADAYRRRAEYAGISEEYLRTKARTTRRFRLLASRLAGELSEEEYRNLREKDKRDLAAAKKRKKLARQWVRGKVDEAEYRRRLTRLADQD